MSKYIARLNALLAQSEGAATPEEAEAYLTKAQELATVYGLSTEVLKASRPSAKAAVPTVRGVTLTDDRTRPFRNRLVSLFSAIANQNDCQITIYNGDCRIDVYGFETDIDTCEVLYASLSMQMVKAGNESLARNEHKAHVRTRFNNRTWQYETKPVNGRAWRGSFYDGFISRISVRLREARVAAEKRAAALQQEDEARFAELLGDSLGEDYVPAENAPATREVGLVLADKKEKVNAHYKEATKGIRGSWKGGSSSTHVGQSAGRSAADRAQIGARSSIGGSRAAIGS